jgi:hypothetical protein
MSDERVFPARAASLAEVQERVIGWTDDEDEPARARPAPSLDRMRAHARTIAELHSVPAIARATGLSRSGLRSFLDGGPIRGKSRGKLFRYLVRSAFEADERARKAAEMLLAITDELPPEEQVAAVAGMVGQLAREFQQRTSKVPPWLSALVATVAPYAPNTSPDPAPPRPGPGSGN